MVQQLGLLNTRWAIILPGAMSVFNVIITRTFYQMTIPKEMLEAAKVDGAIRLPVLPAGRAAAEQADHRGQPALLRASRSGTAGSAPSSTYRPGSVSTYSWCCATPARERGEPGQIGGGTLAEILARRKELFDKLKYALIVVAMIPPLIAYPFVQKHFVKGALIGSLK